MRPGFRSARVAALTLGVVDVPNQPAEAVEQVLGGRGARLGELPGRDALLEGLGAARRRGAATRERHAGRPPGPAQRFGPEAAHRATRAEVGAGGCGRRDAGAPERGRPPGGERRLHHDWLRTRAALFEEPRGVVRRGCLVARLKGGGGGRVHFSQTHPTCHHLIRCACSMRQSEGLFLSCSEDARRSRDLFATDRFLRPDSARGGRKLVVTVGSAREEDVARRQPSAVSLALAASPPASR